MTKTKPQVSVIIPSYNYGHFLPDAIDSVLKQQEDGPELEIIVVDDGSADNTSEVANSYGPPVRYIFQENQGLSAARNTGIRNAEGSYLLFLDADDLLGPHVLQKHLDNFSANPDLDLSVSLCVCTGRSSDPATIWPLKAAHLDMHICHSNISPVHTFMMRASVAREVGFFDSGLKACEDYDYWLRCVEKGARFGPMPDAFVVYRQHNNSMTSQMTQQWIHDRVVRTKIGKLLKTVPDFPAAGKFYGWLAYAAGSITSAYGLAAYSPLLASKVVEESAQSVLTAASMTPKTSSEDSHLVISERYFVGEYLRWARIHGIDSMPILKKALAFLASRQPNLNRLNSEQLQVMSRKHFFKLFCDCKYIRADPEFSKYLKLAEKTREA